MLHGIGWLAEPAQAQALQGAKHDSIRVTQTDCPCLHFPEGRCATSRGTDTHTSTLQPSAC
jgi:hypothetical protein